MRLNGNRQAHRGWKNFCVACTQQAHKRLVQPAHMRLTTLRGLHRGERLAQPTDSRHTSPAGGKQTAQAASPQQSRFLGAFPRKLQAVQQHVRKQPIWSPAEGRTETPDRQQAISGTQPPQFPLSHRPHPSYGGGCRITGTGPR